MNRHRDNYASSSGRYLDYQTYTSSSAVRMPTSSAVPQPTAQLLPVQRIEVPQFVVEPAASDHTDR